MNFKVQLVEIIATRPLKWGQIFSQSFEGFLPLELMTDVLLTLF